MGTRYKSITNWRLCLAAVHGADWATRHAVSAALLAAWTFSYVTLQVGVLLQSWRFESVAVWVALPALLLYAGLVVRAWAS